MRQVAARTRGPPAAALERDPVAVLLCCLRSKAEQPTARGPLFLLAKFQRCFVCCEHCGSKKQNQKRPIMLVVALTRAAKGPQLQWPAKRAKSSGNQAGGVLGNGRTGPGQGGKAPGEEAVPLTGRNAARNKNH